MKDPRQPRGTARAAGGAHRCALRGVGLAVLLAWIGTTGCQEATEPDPGGGGGESVGELRFAPPEGAVEVARDVYRDFKVSGDFGVELALRWTRPGEPGAIGPRYRYLPRRLGPDTLTVTYDDGKERHGSRTWIVTVIPPGPRTVVFTPPGPELLLYETQTTAFAAASTWPLGTVTWRLDGTEAGSDSAYVYPAAAVGAHELTVAAALEDSVFTHAWSLDVRPLAEGHPAEVTGIGVMPGDAPGRATLSWDRSLPRVFPLVAYEVRYSFDGPVTAENWATAVDPGGLAWTGGQQRHVATYTPEDDGLEPGRDIWFAVRVRDDRGLLSPLGASVHVRLPDQWWVTGTVAEPDGAPLAGIRVRDTENRHEMETAADGAYTLGPYFELTRIVLEAGTLPGDPPATGWHIARSDTLDFAGDRRRDFRLIPRHDTVPNCFSFGSNFLWYMRTMTRTKQPTAYRPDVNLHHWREYPVPTYAPDWVSPTGVDYAAAVRLAVSIWNASLSAPILDLVDDPAAARLVFTYDLDDGLNYGVTLLDQPGDGLLIMGDATPEHVTCAISPDIATDQTVAEIALHELGHALGIHGHSNCIKIPYLMNIGGYSALENGPENAIHADERLLVEVIRALPTPWNMGAYPLDAP